ncbi:MAG: hypothetical protein QHH09_01295 [Microgenomates group bacterium]|nr:hypothetical protein [Microgenomates group bacterium]
MNKNILLTIVIILLIGGFFLIKNQPSKKQVTNFKEIEKEVAKKSGLKDEKVNISLYKGAKADEDKCGKDGFYIEEKSADFVKNYCRFLQNLGWKLIHQDYSNCDEIKSFGGGYNYEKGDEKIAVSIIRYGENAACFWVNKRN